MESGAGAPVCRAYVIPSDDTANTAMAPKIISAPRTLSEGRAHNHAIAASNSIAPSPMKKPGPTVRFNHGKHEQSAPVSSW